MSDIDNTPAASTSIINYMLNRFMPFIMVAGLLFLALGFDSYVPYVVLGFMWFATKFSFTCGVASAIMPEELEKLNSKILADNLSEDESTNKDKEE